MMMMNQQNQQMMMQQQAMLAQSQQNQQSSGPVIVNNVQQQQQGMTMMRPGKDTATGYLLWCACFLFICGAHRFYYNRPISGLLYVLHLGCWLWPTLRSSCDERTCTDSLVFLHDDRIIHNLVAIVDICHTGVFCLARAKLKQRFSLSSIPSCRYRTAASLNFSSNSISMAFCLWPLHDPSFGLTPCVKKGSTLSTSVFLTRLRDRNPRKLSFLLEVEAP